MPIFVLIIRIGRQCLHHLLRRDNSPTPNLHLFHKPYYLCFTLPDANIPRSTDPRKLIRST